MNTWETFLDFVIRLQREAKLPAPNASPVMFAIDQKNVAEVAALLTVAQVMERKGVTIVQK